MLYGKQEVYALLEERGIPFERLEHEAVYTMEEADKIGLRGLGINCKNLFLREKKGGLYLVAVSGEKRVDLKSLSAQIGAKHLGFASAERLMEYLGVTQGSVSPLGVLNDERREVTVVMDTALGEDDMIGVHPNENTATIWLSVKDLCRVIKDHGNPVIWVDIGQ